MNKIQLLLCMDYPPPSLLSLPSIDAADEARNRLNME